MSSSSKICFVYLLSPFRAVPNAPTKIGIVCVLTRFHSFWISISRAFYLHSFSAVLLTMLVHMGTATSTMVHIRVFVSCTTISGLLHFTLKTSSNGHIP